MDIPIIAGELGLNRRPAVLRDALWWMIIFMAFLVAMLIWRIPGMDAAASVPKGMIVWISVVAWQPLVEELLFRGLLQGLFLEKAWGRISFAHLSVANLVTSLLFVAVHFIYHSPLWAVSVFIPSIIFGWLRERHGNTWSPIITHALFNLAFFTSAALAVAWPAP